MYLSQLQVNSLFAHSTLKKEIFNQAKKALGVNTPGLQTHNTTRFLSRFGSVKAVVLNYAVLLKFTSEEGGRAVQLKDVERQQLQLAALTTRLASIQGEVVTLDQRAQTTWASLQQYPAPGPDSNPEYVQQYERWYGPTLACEARFDALPCSRHILKYNCDTHGCLLPSAPGHLLSPGFPPLW